MFWFLSFLIALIPASNALNFYLTTRAIIKKGEEYLSFLNLEKAKTENPQEKNSPVRFSKKDGRIFVAVIMEDILLARNHEDNLQQARARLAEFRSEFEYLQMLKIPKNSVLLGAPERDVTIFFFRELPFGESLARD